MLKKFSVVNFKNFKNKITFDLAIPYNYGFNKEVIVDGCITKGILYGINSSGKSNMGLALFDIVCHLTDKQRLIKSYEYYLNMESQKSFAEFEYVFQFNGKELIYHYGKTNVNSLTFEKVSIDGKEVIFYDFQNKDGYTCLKGAETLNNTIKNDSPISRVKYVSNNAILLGNEENNIFQAFIDYVNHMLLFYSLDERGYQGFMIGGEDIAQGIIESGKIKDFQAFLADNEIFYELIAVERDGRKSIYCKFENKIANFFSIVSTGTRSLALFYYWYIKMQQASLVYMDEFDAFYHFKLSQNIVKLLKKIDDVQIFMTTHNTNLMSNDLLRPDCYFKVQDGTVRSLADLTDKEIRKAHNLQKMYKAGAFDGK